MMKYLKRGLGHTVILLMVMALLTACKKGKSPEQLEKEKQESVARADSVARANAPVALAFGALNGYEVNKADDLKDSLNFFLLYNQQDLDHYFKKTGATADLPGFIINFTVAIIGQPTSYSTTIVMDKVELGSESINVWLTVTRGDKLNKPYRPGQVFSIERHSGYPRIQFYVNGKQGGVIELPMDI
ncbi:MAG: hypothetical protein JST14_07940 [Bacteroidetes bacterium]|nr:hypothetical protein [Bacteroidota bacterium]